jgi:hypothetical protein
LRMRVPINARMRTVSISSSPCKEDVGMVAYQCPENQRNCP